MEPTTLQDVTRCVATASWVVLYISRPGCGVCSALRPKIEEIIRELPDALYCPVDLDRIPEAAGEYSVFTIPAILVFVDGRESIREARYLSVDDLRNRIERLYSLRFGE
jgi:thioredoxin-like negative regulator of GroEL